MWRLLEILDRYPEVHVTAPISGIAIEQYPDLIRAWHERGHEICSHSWAQDVRTWKLSTDEEEANISRCSEVTRKVTGQAPTGWISPSAQQGDETLRLLHNAGYLWHGDCSDDDVPYLVDVPGGGSMVAIPYQYDLNDLKIYIKGMNHAGVYVTWFQQKFDTLYAEGVTSPKMINATVHAALYGRPYGSWAFEECIKYARQHSNVWFATRAEIADWVRKRAMTQSDS
jgi:peptidoglycan/xylan/chitin deacetylase (PgdA/CDA1 family)